MSEELSPFQQEELFRVDPWRVLVGCILCNRAPGTRVRHVAYEIFRKWPTAKAMTEANGKVLLRIIQSLGFQNQRVQNLINMSAKWIEMNMETEGGNWTGAMIAAQFPGCGKYAGDSWDLFVRADYFDVKPDDSELKAWKREMCLDEVRRITGMDLRNHPR